MNELQPVPFKNVTPPSIKEIEHLFAELPPPNAPHKTKTVFFDLDETLIHFVGHDGHDGVNFNETHPDAVVTVKYSDYPKPVRLGFNIRPFAIECLKAANEHYQVVVFTAAEQ